MVGRALALVAVCALVVLVALAALVAPDAPCRSPATHVAGSRYVSWLPSFSVEVTRREPRPAESAVAAEAAALQRVFPQYTLTTLAADLQRTRSAHLTLDNILEGRLPPTEMAEEPPASEPPASEPPASEPPASGTPGSGPPASEPAMPFQPVSAVVAPVHVEAAPAHVEPHVVVSAPEPPATVSASTSTGDLTHSTHVHDGRFSVLATEREASLRRRKEQLVRAARDKYLARNTRTH